jgi:CRISPR-associated protein Csm5
LRAAEQCKRDDPKRAAVRLEEIGFQFTRDKTELDPLRGLSVSDAVLGANAARVDRATVVKRSGEEDVAGIRMYYERLPAVADRMQPAAFEIAIGVDTALARRRGEGTPDWKVEWPLLIQHCNEFYRRRWQAERTRFGDIHAGINPAALPPGAIFLRIGRFSHFESLSVDELREGWNVQARKPMKEGSTRTLCELAVEGGKAPFGWVALEPLR